MKNTQAFSNKMVDLTGMQDYERITAEFNRLTKDYYAKEKNPDSAVPHLASNTDQTCVG